MSIRFKYALILTVSCAVLNLILYFTGLQTDRLATGQHFIWLQPLMMVIVLWLGIKATRQETPGHELRYAQGVMAGVLISLYAGLMSGVYNAFHFKYVNPRFVDFQLACLRPDWLAAGRTNAEIAQEETMHRLAMTPLAQIFTTPAIAVCFGLIVSLILAAFLKRPAFKGTSPGMKA